MAEIQQIRRKQPIETSVCSPSGEPTKRPAHAFLYLSWLAVAGLLLARIPLILHRCFDPDEFEHSHAAWCVSRGMIPYKDFFEHHTPWYYYAVRPFFHLFDVTTSVESARRFLLLGRGLSLVLTALSIFLVLQVGRLWEYRKVGLLAGLLLLSQPVFLDKTLEVRPDVLALPLFIGSLWMLLRGLARSARSTRKGLSYFLGGGLGLGAAIMCTQKMLFVLPGVLVGLAVWSLAGVTAGESRPGSHRETRVGAGSRLLLMLVFLIGCCVPAASTWAAFSLQGAGREFITNNLLLNLKWKHIETHQLHRFIETSWPILALCLLGIAMALLRFLRLRERRYDGLLLLSTLAGLFAGLLVMPSAYGQYYLGPLPLVCLFAAQGLLFLVERARRRVRPVLLVLALFPLAILPAFALRESFALRNDGQLARLRFVFENTGPKDVVMDGWQGMGVFRPHAFHYFFLHPETVAMLPRPHLDAYLDALESGAIRPKLIAMDWNLAALGPRFQEFVTRNYVSNDGLFYFLRGTWQAQGTRGGPAGAEGDPSLGSGFWQHRQGGLLRAVRGF